MRWSNRTRDFRFWQILWQKSFWGGDRKFLKPLMRFTRGEVRDHIVSSKIDHGLRKGVEKRRGDRVVRRSTWRVFLACSILDLCNKIGTFETWRPHRAESVSRGRAEVVGRRPKHANEPEADMSTSVGKGGDRGSVGSIEADHNPICKCQCSSMTTITVL
jgi:hypothetical protein